MAGKFTDPEREAFSQLVKPTANNYFIWNPTKSLRIIDIICAIWLDSCFLDNLFLVELTSAHTIDNMNEYFRYQKMMIWTLT